MSISGRTAHNISKAKHAQRSTVYVKPAVIDNDSWFTAGLDACRKLAGGENVILAHVFAGEMDVSSEEADRRLRYLSMMGVLQMHAERNDGKFLRYYWKMVDPNLPKQTELHKS